MDPSLITEPGMQRCATTRNDWNTSKQGKRDSRSDILSQKPSVCERKFICVNVSAGEKLNDLVNGVNVIREATINKIFSTLQKNNTTPTTELIFHSDFELLIAVMLSAQATDKSVNKATEHLFLVANTPKKMIALGLDGLKKYIKTINLYPTKAKHIIQTCNILIEKFNSRVPSNRDDLESLPGVGRKTANVILNTAFDEPAIAVDTHIFRVANRIGLSNGKTPRAVENDLMKIIPKKYLKNAHHWLVLHGRYVCTARNPKCDECLIAKWCAYPNKQT